MRRLRGPVRSIPCRPGAQLGVVRCRQLHVERRRQRDLGRAHLPDAVECARRALTDRSQATSGCRLSAAKRVMERLTTTHSACGENGRIPSAVASSPVTSAIGTRSAARRAR